MGIGIEPPVWALLHLLCLLYLVYLLFSLSPAFFFVPGRKFYGGFGVSNSAFEFFRSVWLPGRAQGKKRVLGSLSTLFCSFFSTAQGGWSVSHACEDPVRKVGSGVVYIAGHFQQLYLEREEAKRRCFFGLHSPLSCHLFHMIFGIWVD